MTSKYNNVYIEDTYTIGGPYEADGPLAKYYDKLYKNDLYFNESSFEKAESKLMKESVELILKKTNKTKADIELLIAGDLQNQIASSNYMARDIDIPFLGIYNACATSSEGIIIASTFIDSKKIKSSICSVSSHNNASEKQFRNPVEYGGPKPKTATFTVTGAVSVLLSNKKSKVKVESSTIGRVCDMGIKDANHMGAVMAISAADTIYRHLTDLKRDPSYYDLILTGDLGVYGKNILTDYMKTAYNLDITKNYNDCGTMIYDVDRQPVYAGGSGPACSALVNFGYIYKEMLKGKYRRVLIVPTGAIFSPTFVFQKESIPSIAHAISLEVTI
ncbi:MAG: stage V sporulation protein AD [Tenericutes bacterium]|nr:stage V sporulation protein AD [Mycoplasmatota bacterium]